MSSRNAEQDSMYTRLLPWTVAASFLLHGVAFASLGAAPPAAKPAQRKTQLRFDVVERAKPAPPEPPRPAPQAEPPKPRQKKPEPPPPPLPPVEAPPPRAVSDGITLAGDDAGPGFAMPLGSGGSLEPTRVRASAPVNVPVPAPAAASPAKIGPAFVPVGDLSSRPSPPSLASALERNYPADARRRGLSGTAKVRARIDPDGVVRHVALLEASGPGFGSACSRTLSGSRWAAPKDKAGRAVATEIRYTCRFVVE